jgi:pimeloyl-ACP methyl ester carboxylesterase
MFEADVRHSFRLIMQRPDRRPGGSRLRRAAELLKPAAERRLLSSAELEVYTAAFRRTGFRGPINWYRNLRADWERAAGLPDHVAAPALMITAELDPFLPPKLARGMERYVPDLETRMIPGSGHWTQQEAPEAVNRILLDWLDRRFPLGAEAESP